MSSFHSSSLELPMAGSIDEMSLWNRHSSMKKSSSSIFRRKKTATRILALCMMCCGYLAIPKTGLGLGGGSGLGGLFSSSSPSDLMRNLAVSVEKSVHSSADGTDRSPFQKAQLLSEVLPAFRLGTALHKISPEFRDEGGDAQSGRDGDSTSRALSTWDGATCEWEPGEPVTGDVFSTFIVGFPGTGKRLAWQLMESLSGAVSGDDWNHSLNNYNVAFMKGSFPQHESSVWLWGSEMDQSVLMLRHPADAIRSYRDVRYELAYSTTWEGSHAQKENTYSYEGPMDHFYWWKNDGGFTQEMKLWSWFIDFWMENGVSRNKEHELVGETEVSYSPKRYKIIGYDYNNQIGVNTNVEIGDDTSQPQYEDTSQPPNGEDTNTIVGQEIVEYDYDTILFFEDAFNVTYDENGTVVFNETIQVPVYEPIYQDIYKKTYPLVYPPLYEPVYEPILEEEKMIVPKRFPKCTDGSMISCKPVNIISFENLNNPSTGPTEMAKLANQMLGKTGVSLIPQDAWNCLYTETMTKSGEFDTKGMNYRDARSPTRFSKHYTSEEVELMRTELEYVRDKYSGPQWDFDSVANELVGYINGYLGNMPVGQADANVGPSPANSNVDGAATDVPDIGTEMSDADQAALDAATQTAR